MLLHQGFPAHQVGVAVRATQGFFRQHFRVIGRQVQAHVEGFLQVAGLGRVQLFGGDGAIATVVAGLGDVDLELFFDGQDEEALGAAQYLGDARRADGMALDVEKAPLAAGAVDLLGDGLPGAGFIAVERADVDDGKAVHTAFLT
ncbi:hypothetical protein D3C76_1334740 [compost metagenome]